MFEAALQLQVGFDRFALFRYLGVPGFAIDIFFQRPDTGLHREAADFYAELADSRNIPVDTDILSDVLSDRSLKSDTVHPNDAGYGRIAEALFGLLKDSGAIY